MACKIPCVLTRIPAFIDLNEHEDFACFVSPRDPQGIADGVAKIMMDNDYRISLVNRGFQVAQSYSLDMVGDKLANFLLKRERHYSSNIRTPESIIEK
jgi:glycosyltransferase involved in cell wall biosynthesis